VIRLIKRIHGWLAKISRKRGFCILEQQTNEVYVDVQKLPAAPAGQAVSAVEHCGWKTVDMGMLDNAVFG
jgi:hypothetical protein